MQVLSKPTRSLAWWEAEPQGPPLIFRRALSHPLTSSSAQAPTPGSRIPSPSQGTLICQPCTLTALLTVSPPPRSPASCTVTSPNTAVSPGVGMGSGARRQGEA